MSTLFGAWDRMVSSIIRRLRRRLAPSSSTPPKVRVGALTQTGPRVLRRYQPLIGLQPETIVRLRVRLSEIGQTEISSLFIYDFFSV